MVSCLCAQQRLFPVRVRQYAEIELGSYRENTCDLEENAAGQCNQCRPRPALVIHLLARVIFLWVKVEWNVAKALQRAAPLLEERRGYRNVIKRAELLGLCIQESRCNFVETTPPGSNR